MFTAYQFVIRKSRVVEVLGEIELENDAQAILFGGDIVQDLMCEQAAHFAGFTMDITKRQRAVSSIPFEK